MVAPAVPLGPMINPMWAAAPFEDRVIFHPQFIAGLDPAFKNGGDLSYIDTRCPRYEWTGTEWVRNPEVS